VGFRTIWAFPASLVTISQAAKWIDEVRTEGKTRIKQKAIIVLLHKNFALSRKTQPPQPPSPAKAPPPTPHSHHLAWPITSHRLNVLLSATTPSSPSTDYTSSSSFFKHIEANKQQK